MAARTVPEVASMVIGALVAVVAHDAFAEILSAHAVHTDARNAVPVAGRCVQVLIAARTVPEVAMVLGALVAVVARVVFAGVLSAHAIYTDTGKAIEVAFLTVIHRNVVALTGWQAAGIVGSCVLVVAVLVALAWSRLTASHERNHAQRADT